MVQLGNEGVGASPGGPGPNFLGPREAQTRHGLKVQLDVGSTVSRGSQGEGVACHEGTPGSVWRRFWVAATEGGVRLASAGWRPGVLSNIPPCTARPPPQGAVQPQTSTVPGLRSLGRDH